MGPHECFLGGEGGEVQLLANCSENVSYLLLILDICF